MHMAARAADADMMGVLLNALPESARTDLINGADRSGITPVFLAFQRCDFSGNGLRLFIEGWQLALC